MSSSVSPAQNAAEDTWILIEWAFRDPGQETLAAWIAETTQQEND